MHNPVAEKVSFKAILALLTVAALANAQRFRNVNDLDGYLDRTLPNNRYLKGARGERVKRAVIPLMGRIIAKGGCNPNVCFALDGSGSVGSDDYAAQKEFVELAAVLIGIDKSAHFAAVQYTQTLTEISPLTSEQVSFLNRVTSSRGLGGGTFVAAGLAYCVRQLRRRTEDANKIVLLGDGRNNFGSGIPTGPLRSFLPPRGRGEVCAVGVGRINMAELIKIAGSADRVFQSDDYFSLVDVVDELVAGLCRLY